MTIYLNLIDDENKIIIKKNLIQINNKKRCSEFYFKLMKKKRDRFMGLDLRARILN